MIDTLRYIRGHPDVTYVLQPSWASPEICYTIQELNTWKQVKNGQVEGFYCDRDHIYRTYDSSYGEGKLYANFHRGRLGVPWIPRYTFPGDKTYIDPLVRFYTKDGVQTTPDPYIHDGWVRTSQLQAGWISPYGVRLDEVLFLEAGLRGQGPDEVYGYGYHKGKPLGLVYWKKINQPLESAIKSFAGLELRQPAERFPWLEERIPDVHCEERYMNFPEFPGEKWNSVYLSSTGSRTFVRSEPSTDAEIVGDVTQDIPAFIYGDENDVVTNRFVWRAVVLAENWQDSGVRGWISQFFRQRPRDVDPPAPPEPEPEPPVRPSPPPQDGLFVDVPPYTFRLSDVNDGNTVATFLRHIAATIEAAVNNDGNPKPAPLPVPGETVLADFSGDVQTAEVGTPTARRYVQFPAGWSFRQDMYDGDRTPGATDSYWGRHDRSIPGFRVNWGGYAGNFDYRKSLRISGPFQVTMMFSSDTGFTDEQSEDNEYHAFVFAYPEGTDPTETAQSKSIKNFPVDNKAIIQEVVGTFHFPNYGGLIVVGGGISIYYPTWTGGIIIHNVIVTQS